MSRTIPTYTDDCHCLTVDSDNTPLPHIPPADKCTSVNGNRTGPVILTLHHDVCIVARLGYNET